MPEKPDTNQADAGQSDRGRVRERLDQTGRRHLANALRVSFRVLTVGMIGVVVLFLCSGVSCIEPESAGIVKVFGRVVKTVDQGLAVTWPFPVGEIEEVDVKIASVPVKEFWLYISPEDQTKPLTAVRPQSEGLRPAWDGALLTGDHSLLHVKLGCHYTISDPVAVKANMSDLKAAVRNAVCSAGIRSAATGTADGLRRTGREQLKKAIKTNAQRRLNLITLDRPAVAALRAKLDQIVGALEPQRRRQASKKLQKFVSVLMQGLRDRQMRDEFLQLIAPGDRTEVRGLLMDLVGAFDHDGVKIITVVVDDMTWPLRAQPAYNDAEKARSDAAVAVNKAMADAHKMLYAAAGRNYRKLVGPLTGTAGRTSATSPAEKDVGLIGRYIEARRAGDEQKAQALLPVIEEVLRDNETGGEARKLISEARALRFSIRQRVEARLDEFNKRIAGYEAAPRLTLDRLWVDMRDKILGNPMAEKIFLPKTDRKIVIEFDRPADIAKQIRDQLLKKAKEKTKRSGQEE